MALKIISVPLSDLSLDRKQVRTSGAGEGIDELATSIAKIGLIHPIAVAELSEPGKYQVIAGQRRLLATAKLGRNVIQATVIDPEKVKESGMDLETYLDVFSYSENSDDLRKGLKRQDKINLVESLYRKYGTIVAVVQETGLSNTEVRRYTRLTRVRSNLKHLYIDEGIDVEVVLQAQDMATNPETGAVNEEKAIQFANGLKVMDNPARKVVVQAVDKNPELGIKEALAAGRNAPKIEKITLPY